MMWLLAWALEVTIFGEPPPFSRFFWSRTLVKMPMNEEYLSLLEPKLQWTSQDWTFDFNLTVITIFFPSQHHRDLLGTFGTGSRYCGCEHRSMVDSH